MGEWYNNTCIADQIEVHVMQPEGRYRWRLKQLRLPGRRGIYDCTGIEEPWNYGPVPEKLKPRWMK